MAAQTIYDLPPAEAERIRQEVLRKISEMDVAEYKMQQQAFASFAEFLTQIAYEIAGILGYTVAIPLAWAQNVAEGISVGISDGFNRGLREQRAHPRRRR